MSGDEGGRMPAPVASRLAPEQAPAPAVLSRGEHGISRANISENALKVLYRLHRAGFLGYLVGGAVRDLMLGRRPKDFDIGTNARPQQVRQLFHNARLIGRRFRLARLLFGGEVVEVATFRRSPVEAESDEGQAVDVLAPAQESLEFGTPDEDAWRRDLTVNGMFYNIANFTVIDYVGGIEDLRRGVIRTIGAPAERFDEDPVRMMRAVEYAARLGFTLEAETADAIRAMHAEVRRAAPARIAYELMESLTGGHALAIFRGLELYGLLEHIVPEAHFAVLRGHDKLLWKLLEQADAAKQAGRPFREEILLALLFLPPFLDALGEGRGKGLQHPDLDRIVKEQIDPPALRLAFSNHRAHLLRSAFFMMARFAVPPRSGKLAARMQRQEAFSMAWQLAHMLVTAGATAFDGLEAWGQAIERLEGGPALPEGSRQVDSNGPARRRRRRRGGRRRKAEPAPATRVVS